MNSQANPFSNNQNVPNDRPESLWAWESEERARNFIESGYSNHRRKVSCANFPATGTGRYSTIVDAVWGHCFDIYEESTHHEFAGNSGNPRLFRKAISGPESSGRGDAILMPPQATFINSQAYYGVALHELSHWTGHKSRCDRSLEGRFGSEAYAIEELITELSAAFLSAELGIASEPRIDHARYISSWLRVLKNDKRAIFTTATKASEAAYFLTGLASVEQARIAA